MLKGLSSVKVRFAVVMLVLLSVAWVSADPMGTAPPSSAIVCTRSTSVVGGDQCTSYMPTFGEPLWHSRTAWQDSYCTKVHPIVTSRPPAYLPTLVNKRSVPNCLCCFVLCGYASTALKANLATKSPQRWRQAKASARSVLESPSAAKACHRLRTATGNRRCGGSRGDRLPPAEVAVATPLEGGAVEPVPPQLALVGGRFVPAVNQCPCCISIPGCGRKGDPVGTTT